MRCALKERQPAKILWTFLVLLVAGAGCEVDPLSQREIPTVGMVYTPNSSSVKDIHTQGDSIPSGPVEDVGLDSVEPSKGSPAGSETVFVHGWGFTKSVEVFFNDRPALDVFYVNSKKLRITTPAHPLGFADVSVRWPSGKTKTLPSVFLYETDLALDSVEPKVGPVSGGTPMTITGAGFTTDAAVVVGHRLALHIEVVDEGTVFAVTPPGEQGGPADVYVTSAAGIAVAKGAFTYSVLPEIDHLRPGAGPVAGGVTVEILGKWMSPVTQVQFGGVEAEVLLVEKSRVVAVAPPGSAGFADVVVIGSWGWASLEDGYYYYSSGSPAGGIEAVVPWHGPEAGGNAVSIVGCGITAEEVTGVYVGDTAATVLSTYPEQCSILVKMPPGEGTADVLVVTSGGEFLKTDAYQYEASMTVEAVEPKVGPDKGGTKIRVFGSNFTENSQVLVGPMPAGEVTFVNEEELEARTPPGSPGLADVTVLSGLSKASLDNAFLYTVKEPQIWLVTPNYGSQAGGTFMEIIGAGFTPGAMVFVGEGICPDVSVMSYGRVWAYTPPNSVGTYDVTVSADAGQAELPDSYTCFDPTSWYGGTWGQPIDGAVNVTVFDAAEWAPLEGATVVLGSDPDTPFRGDTDINGQVTLSGPVLEGPVDIHTTKQSYDAASIVHMDAENATLYLIPLYPPSTGPTDPVEPLAPGSVAGRVVGLGKYVVVPPGDCKNKEPGSDNLCLPCMVDEDCGDGSVCLGMGKSGKYCTYACGQIPDEEPLGDEDPDGECPQGYMCAPVAQHGTHCMPALGYKSARCEVTATSIYSFTYGDPYVTVDDDDHYEMESRLGEVAVVCLGGWTDPDTGEFHPLAMGVKRHVNVPPGTDLKDLNIWLNIPLSKRMRLRMDDPPKFIDYKGLYRVQAFLDFGSDGIFHLPGEFEGLSADDVELTNLPASLSGDLFDANYIIYAGAYTNTDDNTPYSIVRMDDIADVEETAAAVLTDGLFENDPAAPGSDALNAAWGSASSAVVVGDGGRMFGVTSSGFFQLPTIVDNDLFGVFGFPDQTAYAVGDNGVVLRRSVMKWELLGAATDMPLRSVWGSDPGDVHAVGKYRIASLYSGTWHELKVSFDLHGVWGRGPDDVWAVGRDGVVLYYDGLDWSVVDSPADKDLFAVRAWPSGRVVVAGDGVAFVRDESGSWQDMGLSADYRAATIRGQESDFFLGGTPALVARWTSEAGFEYLEAPHNLDVRDVLFAPGGEIHAVGSPALLIAPFVPFPVFDHPMDHGKFQALLLDWHYDGNTDPITLHTMNLTEKTGQSLWRFTVDGSQSFVALPDFPEMIGVNPITAAEKRLRIYSAYAPEFSINSFDITHLGTGMWRSWAYDMIGFDETGD